MKKFFHVFAILVLTNLFIVPCLAQVDLSKGLVAWYPMNGNAKSSVGTGEDCTINGATLTTDRFGNANSAYYFNGSANLIANFNSTGFSGLSFSGWIKTSSTSTNEIVIQSPSAFVGYISRFDAGHFMAAFDAGTANNNSTDETTDDVVTGNWVFISASNDGSTTRVYLNGKLENSYAEVLATTNTQVEIGGGVGGSVNQFIGSIDEVRIYNRQLSDAEMNALYNSDCLNDITNGLVAWYPMSGNAKCAVGTGLDCTVTGATLTTDRFGRPNNAYFFDGNSNLVTNFNSSGFPGMSYSAWIKTTLTSNPEVFVQGTSSFVGYVNRFTAGHFTPAFDGATGNNGPTDESTANVATGEWEFVSASNDGFITRVYVNGVLENSYQEILATNNGQLAIGHDVGNTGTQFVGSIDEVRVYSRALCDNEMLLLYNRDKSGINGEQIINDPSFEIFPNPSNGIFTINTRNFPLNGIANIYDVNGKLIQSNILLRSENKIDLTSQKAGVYIFSVRTPEAIFTKKIVIE